LDVRIGSYLLLMQDTVWSIRSDNDLKSTGQCISLRKHLVRNFAEVEIIYWADWTADWCKI